jgi:hypothetical protein
MNSATTAPSDRVMRIRYLPDRRKSPRTPLPSISHNVDFMILSRESLIWSSGTPKLVIVSLGEQPVDVSLARIT